MGYLLYYEILPILLLTIIGLIAYARNNRPVDVADVKKCISEHWYTVISIGIVLWCLFLYLITELLSLGHLLCRNSVLITWGTVDIVLLSITIYLVIADSKADGYVSTILHSLADSYRSFDRLGQGIIYIAILFAIFVIVVARLTVPYNWDSMEYHLPRIFFWAQYGSVEYYATNEVRQLSSPYIAEYINLHYYLLADNDYCVNLLQAFSFLFNASGVYAISKKLGLNRRLSLISVLIYASIPIAFSEAFTTQVDNVATVCMLIYVYNVLLLINEEKINLKKQSCLCSVLMLGAALGLGYVTKPSVCIGMVIFAFGLLIARLIRRDGIQHLILSMVLVVVTALILVLPQLTRNLEAFDALSAPSVGERQLVGTIEPRYVLTNFVKNLVFNCPNSYIYSSETVCYKIVEKTADVLGVELNDPAISEDGREFTLNAYNEMHPDLAINALVFHLFIICLVISLIRLRKNKRNVYVICTFISFLVLLAIMRWEQYETRYEIAYLALLCPTIVYVISENAKSKQMLDCVMTLIAFLAIVGVLNLCIFNLGECVEEAYTRPYGYFVTNREIGDEYTEAIEYISNLKDKSVGIISDGGYIYPMLYMCDNINKFGYILYEGDNFYQYSDTLTNYDMILVMSWNTDNISQILEKVDSNNTLCIYSTEHIRVLCQIY